MNKDSNVDKLCELKLQKMELQKIVAEAIDSYDMKAVKKYGKKLVKVDKLIKEFKEEM